MFTNLHITKNHLPINKINNTSNLTTYYYKSKIYTNILSPINKITIQIHSKYFIIYINLITNILPTNIPSKNTNKNKPKKNQSYNKNQKNKKKFLKQNLIITYYSFTPFIPYLIILILTQ